MNIYQLQITKHKQKLMQSDKDKEFHSLTSRAKDRNNKKIQAYTSLKQKYKQNLLIEHNKKQQKQFILINQKKLDLVKKRNEGNDLILYSKKPNPIQNLNTAFQSISSKSPQLSPTSHARRNPKVLLRPNQAKKTKHPIIRQYIIKEPKIQKGYQMIYSCNQQHNNFVGLLNDCINKRSLIKEKQKCKMNITNSFKNLKVKASLRKNYLNSFNSIQNFYQKNSKIKAKLKEKRPGTGQNTFKRKYQQSSNILTKNQSQVKNCDYFEDKQYQRLQNTGETPYKRQNLIIQNRDKKYQKKFSLNTKKQKNQQNNGQLASKTSNLFKIMIDQSKYNQYPHLNKNYKNLYTKQRKLKTCNKQLKKQLISTDLSNIISSQNKSHCSNNFYYSNPKIGQSINQSLTQDISIEQLTIFTHLPKKRKISTHVLTNQRLSQSDKPNPQKNISINISVIENKDEEIIEQCQQGNSYYLRTVNF